MRWILILLVLVCNFALSQQSTDKPIAQEEQKARQSQSQPQPLVDTSSLEKAIRESIKQASEKPDTHAEKKLEIDRQLVEYTKKLSGFTRWLVLATVILACVAVWQGIHLKRTVRLAEDNAKRQLRAYVCIEDVFFDWLVRGNPHSGYSHNLRLRFKNYGATPAVLASVGWKRAKEAEAAFNDTESLPEFGQMILPPSARFGRPLGSAPGLGYRDRFFVYGRFSYGDIFQMWHTVRFCYVHHWTEATDPEAVGTSVFTPYGEYNYETRHETQKEAMAAT